MGKEKFYYNEQTLRYEKLKTPLKSKLLTFAGILALSCVLAFGLYHVIPSPFERAQAREIQQLELQHIAMNDQVEKMTKVLDNIQDRDANVHRVVFGMDPVEVKGDPRSMTSSPTTKPQVSYYNLHNKKRTNSKDNLPSNQRL